MPALSKGGPSQGTLGTADLRDKASCARAIDWLYRMRTLKDPLEARTARNSAFYDNRQYYEWHGKRRQMVLPEKYRESDDWVIYNMIAPLIDQKLAKMGARDPCWTAPAFTSDPHDQMVSRFANDLLGWYYQFGLGMNAVIDEFLRWYFCSPVVWLEASWDATKGDKVPLDQLPASLDDWYQDIPENTDPAEAERIRREDLQSYRQRAGYRGDDQPVEQYSGDPVVKVRSVFQVMWYPFRVKTWDQVHAYLVTDVMSPEEVAQRFGLPIEEVLARKHSRAASEHYHQVMQAWANPFVDSPDIPPEWDSGIIVHQFYADRTICPPRGPNDPGGCAAVYIEGDKECLKVGPLNNPLCELPLYPAVENPSNGFAWGTCSVDRVIGPQIELNDTKSQVRRWRRMHANPKVLMDLNDGGNLNEWKLDDAPYRCKLDKSPRVFALPEGELRQEEAAQFALRYIHDALAVPDVSIGRTNDTNVRSGRAVIALQDEANQRLRNIGRGLNRVLSQVGTMVMALLQKYAHAERVTPIVGRNNSIEFKAWSAVKLRPSMYDKYPGRVANVNVTTFTNIPMTPGEMQQIALTLLETGAIDPEKRSRFISEVFGLNEFRQFFDRGRLGRDRAAMKVERWRQGLNAPPPMLTDDHEEAIDTISQFVNTDDYLALTVNSPDIAAECDAHLSYHQQGKFDVEAEKVMRLQYAQMRMAQIMAKEAADDKIAPGAVAYFLMQANGGISPATNQQVQDRSAAADQQRDQRKTGTSPKAKTARTRKDDRHARDNGVAV